MAMNQRGGTGASRGAGAGLPRGPGTTGDRPGDRGPGRERADRDRERADRGRQGEALQDYRQIWVNKVSKVVQGGRRFSWAALVVVGDSNGKVGLGYGKAKETPLATTKAVEAARKNQFSVPLAGSTITHPVIGEAGAGRVLLKPAAPGTGVIAGSAARAILEMAGISDVLCKSLGSSNKLNVAHATVAALKALKDPEQVAQARGKSPEEVAPAGLLRAVRERRRAGDVPEVVA